jgi:hypothetical protein
MSSACIDLSFTKYIGNYLRTCSRNSKWFVLSSKCVHYLELIVGNRVACWPITSAQHDCRRGGDVSLDRKRPASFRSVFAVEPSTYTDVVVANVSISRLTEMCRSYNLTRLDRTARLRNFPVVLNLGHSPIIFQ